MSAGQWEHVSHTYQRLTRQKRYLITQDCNKPDMSRKTQSYHLRPRTLFTSVFQVLSEPPSHFEGIFTCLFVLFSFLNGVMFLDILSSLANGTERRNSAVCLCLQNTCVTLQNIFVYMFRLLKGSVGSGKNLTFWDIFFFLRDWYQSLPLSVR